MHFVGVGTPQRPGSQAADMTYVEAAVTAIAAAATKDCVIAGKSTVPVGSARRLAALAAEHAADGVSVELVWNPEFLREGWAVQDTIDPDRLVAGVPPGPAGETAAAVLRQVYHPSVAKGTPFIVTDYATAELVKVAANAFLATKISFINAMAEIAEVTGADVTQLADAIGHDARIGRRFLGAGIGFGGGCLPKDIRAFSARAEELGRGESVAFLRAQGRRVFFDAEHFFDGYRSDATFAMAVLAAAEEAGAERLVLCDTNGGMLPFDSDLQGTIRLKLAGEAPNLTTIVPDMQPALATLVARLLSYDPNRRPRSARSLMIALDAALKAPKRKLRTAEIAAEKDAKAPTVSFAPTKAQRAATKRLRKASSPGARTYAALAVAIIIATIFVARMVIRKTRGW